MPPQRSPSPSRPYRTVDGQDTPMRATARSSQAQPRAHPHLVAVLAEDDPSAAPAPAAWSAPAGRNDLRDRDAVVALFARGPRPPAGELALDGGSVSPALLAEL